MELAQKLAHLARNPLSDLPVSLDKSSEVAQEMFLELAELAKEDGLPTIRGLWEKKLDDDWKFAVNGAKSPQITTIMTAAHRVPPYTLYVEFNGWPAGQLHPDAGGWFCAGAEANAARFLRVLLLRKAG